MQLAYSDHVLKLPVRAKFKPPVDSRRPMYINTTTLGSKDCRNDTRPSFDYASGIYDIVSLSYGNHDSFACDLEVAKEHAELMRVWFGWNRAVCCFSEVPRDPKFSGKVIIYQEDEISDMQKAILEFLFKTQGVQVLELRGLDYVKQKMLTPVDE